MRQGVFHHLGYPVSFGRVDILQGNSMFCIDPAKEKLSSKCIAASAVKFKAVVVVPQHSASLVGGRPMVMSRIWDQIDPSPFWCHRD